MADYKKDVTVVIDDPAVGRELVQSIINRPRALSADQRNTLDWTHDFVRGIAEGSLACYSPKLLRAHALEAQKHLEQSFPFLAPDDADD